MRKLHSFSRILTTTVLIFVFAICFTSCGGDDNTFFTLPEVTDNPDDTPDPAISSFADKIKGCWGLSVDIDEDNWYDEDFEFDVEHGIGKIQFSHFVNNSWGVYAKGTYTLNGNTLTAEYTNVYVSGSSTTYLGFTNNVTRTITYTIVSCDDNKMVLKDASGTSKTYEKYEADDDDVEGR